MLEVEAIHTYYGTSHVLFGVSLVVRPGEVVCLMGRNGAGKTTTLRSIMNLTPPRQGEVCFAGRSTRGLAPHQLARLGLGYVPEDRRIFPDLTVRENLEVASRRGGRWSLRSVFELFTPLEALQHRRGSHLSGGEQQMLTIARTLLTDPRLLLLDEPLEGLAPLVVRQLVEAIRQLRREGIAVLLAEQNLSAALQLADRAYVIERGSIRFEGSVEALRANEDIRRRYLLV